MGSINSGVRGYRGGRASTSSLPVLRLTNADQDFRRRKEVLLTYDAGSDLGTVEYGLRQWHVVMEITQPNFGGFRRWLICPECGSRRRDLYINGERFACRVCLGLCFDSEHETIRQRSFRRADHVRSALGWKPGILTPREKKPRGMHWRTFWNLTEELDARTDALLGIFPELIDRMEKDHKRWLNTGNVAASNKPASAKAEGVVESNTGAKDKVSSLVYSASSIHS